MAARTRGDVILDVMAEIDHHYPRGPLAVAVDGAPGSGATAVARDLSDAYHEQGREVRLVELAPGDDETSLLALAAFDEAAFRRDVLGPFRAAAAPDAVLVVTGPFLLAERLRGIWHFSVYVDSRHAETDEAYLLEASPFFTASVVLDSSGPELRRVFSDSC